MSIISREIIGKLWEIDQTMIGYGKHYDLTITIRTDEKIMIKLWKIRWTRNDNRTTILGLECDMSGYRSFEEGISFVASSLNTYINNMLAFLFP